MGAVAGESCGLCGARMVAGASVCGSCHANRVLDTIRFADGILKFIFVMALVGLVFALPFTGASAVSILFAAAGGIAYLLWRRLRMPVYVKRRS